MSTKLHYAQKWEVRYEESSVFSNPWDFCDLFKELGFWPYENDDSFEIQKSDFENAINLLKNIDSLENKDMVNETLNSNCISPEECIDYMQHLLSSADTTDGYLHFAIF